MKRLQQLALVESLKEIDQSGKHTCIETLGADCVASFLKNIFQNGSDKERKKWLNAVGSSFNEYLEYSHMMNRMGTGSVRELEDAVGRVKFHRGRFCEYIHASRDEACGKPYAYTTRGEFGGDVTLGQLMAYRRRLYSSAADIRIRTTERNTVESTVELLKALID